MSGFMSVSEAPMPDAAGLIKLGGLLPSLSAGDRSFASSLISKGGARGLSGPMRYWVFELIKRAENKDKAPNVVDLAGDFGPVFALFDKASEKLKYPKVRISTDKGEPVVMNVAGPRSKYPGYLNLSDGGPFGANEWYGRVSPDGKWEVPRKDYGEKMVRVAKLLKAFGEDPAGVAEAYGKMSGCCSFCARALSDERSLKVGYGPVCAENYGLPWGEK